MKQKALQPSKMKKKIPLLESKPTKVNGVSKPKEPLKKDLMIQMTVLQNKFDTLEKNIKQLEQVNETLEDTNNKNLEIIKCLQIQIENIKKEKHTLSKQTQTESGIEFKCSECNFEATSNTELSWHLSENHGWLQDQTYKELDMSAGPRFCDKCEYEAEDGYVLYGHTCAEHDEEDTKLIVCQYCEENFPSFKYLMIHKKVEHVDKVSFCWYFSHGCCIYGDKCWFNHKESQNQSDQKSIYCNICGETFLTITQFMKHKKYEHIENVKMCKFYKEGNCSYLENCLFIHENLNKKENENNDKMIQKLFDVVEKFTEKIITVEKNDYENLIKI